MIYIVKVTTNKEEKVLGLVEDKIKQKALPVYSLARPPGLRGYLIVEAPERDIVEEAVFNLPYTKGILAKTASFDEIKTMVEPKVAEINIEKGDIVEIIAEPFKKEKAKVLRIDKQKGEAVVTLLQATIPIPVTVKIDNLRIIRREETEEGEQK
ncbi:MAG: transcription elongation factor Spt5 [Candidatus Pacearchaeota archaeon]|nr:transcription elongation factor Spt5 [Candidatus Pacearchaeota archaeon]